jgi:hypothetical protein
MRTEGKYIDFLKEKIKETELENSKLKQSETEYQYALKIENETGIFGFKVHKKFQKIPYYLCNISTEDLTQIQIYNVICGKGIRSTYVNVNYDDLTAIRDTINKVLDSYEK